MGTRSWGLEAVTQEEIPTTPWKMEWPATNQVRGVAPGHKKKERVERHRPPASEGLSMEGHQGLPKRKEKNEALICRSPSSAMQCVHRGSGSQRASFPT